MKTSGILLPIFSLPSDYGIGCFSKEAYKFVDFLEEAILLIFRFQVLQEVHTILT